ncbi:hypothetical protein H6A15_10275, partial [Enorma phocaeensis]|nr:hypothetical protein [Enorma phocaeensis]
GRWSPEQLEGRIALERPGLAVSDTTIYREIRSGRLDRLVGGRKAAARLRRGGRRRGRGAEETRGKIRVSHELSERPAAADARSRVGDWVCCVKSLSTLSASLIRRFLQERPPGFRRR